MPCYEPPVEHEERLSDFLIQCLCHAVKFIPDADLDEIAGFREWKRRHEHSDNGGNLRNYDTAQGVGGYSGPLFMKQWLLAETKDS